MASFMKKYNSTVFLCETTGDGRYLRCDFNQCKIHPLNKEINKIPVDYWLLNTEKNVSTLEKHVGQEIHDFLELTERKSLIYDREKYELNANLLQNKLFFFKGSQKLLIVFNLRDPQSSFGNWANAFLQAAGCRNDLHTDYTCITLSFSSRWELFHQVEKLRSLYANGNKAEVMIVLSCHSSSQGQVFSCTPTQISKAYGFEEFCSVHDFVRICQDVLEERLKVIHISSCFAMKLNRSHEEWPVHYSWLKKDLKCVLSGSAKEVYETGSQTADLFLVMTTILSSCNIANQYKNVLSEAYNSAFPDLVLEMGLCTASYDVVDAMMENSDREDQVTAPKVIESLVQLVIVCDKQSVALKDAIYCNLQTRLFSDVKSVITVINVDKCDSFQDFNELDKDECNRSQLFFVVLGYNCNSMVLKFLLTCMQHDRKIYGIHFVNVCSSEMTALKQKLNELNLTATGFVYNDSTHPTDIYPVLLYLIHLSLGENGSTAAISASNDPSSKWSFKEVFLEVSNVLTGLARKCNYMLLTETTRCSAITCSGKINIKVPDLMSDDELYENGVGHTSLLLVCQDSVSKETQQADAKKFSSDNHSASSQIVDPLAKEVKDVPLMANVDEVLINHYILDLDVNFSDRRIDGGILLFVAPANADVAQRKFQMCLDCTLIDIISVEEVDLPENFNVHFHKNSCCCNINKCYKEKNIEEVTEDKNKLSTCKSCTFIQNFQQHKINSTESNLKYQTLSYAVYGWCIRVWTEDLASKCWPKCVYIKYRTNPDGPSLMWCQDQDGNPSCFTPGAYLNNRTMMPCQEPPVAVATWQAKIQVPKGFSVLSSGDTIPCLKNLDANYSEKDVFHFEMSIPLQSTTLAFTFSKLTQSSKSVTVLTSPNNKAVTVSLYAPKSIITDFEKEYLDLTSEYLVHTCNLLGEYPFSRLDMVIMPRSFACMGLSSPNLIFLSQSVLCGDQSMSSRVAHEISHAWFGLLLGIQDWTEEWLSEGFATFLEERILAARDHLSPEEVTTHHELWSLLKYKTLTAELDVTEDENLKLMKPKKVTKGTVQYLTAVEAVDQSMKEGACDVKPHSVIPNAAIASKRWSQVHYMKGYFLLHHMAEMVDYEAFDAFLKIFVTAYQGKLLTSELFFEFFIGHFKLSRELKDIFSKEWLESSSLPIVPASRNIENYLMRTVTEEFQFWKANNIANKRCKSRGVKRKRSTFKQQRPNLNSNAIVLLLEDLLEIDVILSQTMTQLNNVYHFEKLNAEIRHRWCELIVKHGYSSKYEQVQRYLVEDQGMGIYLFGELMLSENSKQKQLAKETFGLIKNEMDKSTKETVQEIVYDYSEST